MLNIEVFVETRHFAELRVILRSRVLVINVLSRHQNPFEKRVEGAIKALRNAGRDILGGVNSETISAPEFRRRPSSSRGPHALAQPTGEECEQCRDIQTHHAIASSEISIHRN